MTTKTKEPPAAGQHATIVAEYGQEGQEWKLYSTGAIQRGGDLVANYSPATGALLWETKEMSRRYRLPVSRLLAEAKWKPAKVSAKDFSAVEPVVDAPPRPPQHPDYGEYTPSLVRWRYKFAPEEFELIYGVISTKDTDRQERPVRRKDIYPDYQSRFAEDQPAERQVTWRKPGGIMETLVIERHSKGDPIPSNIWRCYGEEVVATERKYPALCETVLTYIAAGVGDDLSQSRTADPNIQY